MKSSIISGSFTLGVSGNLSFEVCRYLPLLGVNNTTDKNETQMKSQTQKQTQMLGVNRLLGLLLLSTLELHSDSTAIPKEVKTVAVQQAHFAHIGYNWSSWT